MRLHMASVVNEDINIALVQAISPNLLGANLLISQEIVARFSSLGEFRSSLIFCTNHGGVISAPYGGVLEVQFPVLVLLHPLGFLLLCLPVQVRKELVREPVILGKRWLV
ncbi:WD repeat protein-like protein [Sesbania bispinosa]|nr:WD repeat protein-like protein [Sesbania bispinosa]